VLAPFETLLAAPPSGAPLPLPAELAALYPGLAFSRSNDAPYVISNFVATLDGVVTLGLPGQSGGGEVSGFNAHDRALMAILRAAADAVLVGAGTHRALPGHRWTPEHVAPQFGPACAELRRALGLRPAPLTVVLTGSGRLDAHARIFAEADDPVLVVTSPDGAVNVLAQRLHDRVRVAVVDPHDSGRLGAADTVAHVASALGMRAPLVLVEGGPEVMGRFFAERYLHELFLTVAPQVAGRAGASGDRPGLVSGQALAPDDPRWGTLTSVHRAGNHLFLRYTFADAQAHLGRTVGSTTQ
jgi:riboflavin biosynthesis pyrimidine reductase